MKYFFALIGFGILLSSLALAEKLYARSLRAEWTKAKMVSSMTAPQAMNINGAKAAYRNSLGFIGNQKNSIPFGVSFVGFKDANVTNSIGFSYNGQPKSVPEFANASSGLMGYLVAACLGATEKTGLEFAKFFFDTIDQASKSTKPISVQRQFGVFNMYIGNATVNQQGISYSVVISTTGVLGKAGWVEYCNPKQ